jgi:hypothetical protein
MSEQETGAMQKKPEVLIAGAEYLHLIVSQGSQEYDNCIVRTETITSNLKHHRLQEWDIVVLPYRMYLTMSRGGLGYCSAPLVDIVHLEQQVYTALKRGTAVCFLVEHLIGHPYPDDSLVPIKAVYEYLGSEELNNNIIGHRVLTNLGIIPNLDAKLTTHYQVKKGEFTKYLQNFGAGSIWFELSGISDKVDVICSDVKGNATGFCLQRDKGNILFLPYLRHKRIDFDEAAEALTSAIVTYLSRIEKGEPEWVGKSFVFVDEKPLLQKRRRLEMEIEKLDSQLSRFKELRTILWQRDYALQNSVPRFLKLLGMETRQDEQFEEDFWVTQGGKDIVIAEVKSMNGNVSRQDIGKLDDHRKARNKPDDFPGLLVVNTFAALQDPEGKNKRIEPNECKRAVTDHILVMRTIDLLNLYELISQKRLQLEQFIDLLLNASGWLKVSGKNYEVISH